MFSFQFTISTCILFIAIILHVNALEGIQVIVINSTYTNSTVKTTNNFESLLNGLANHESKNGAQQQLQSTLINSSAGVSVNLKEQNVASTPPKTFVDQSLPPQHSNFFGAAFSPYVNNDMVRMNGYTNEDIKKMLKVILTKCHSVLTFEMGYYANPYFFGPYEATSSSKIASSAAEINLQRNTSILTISQGAFILYASFASQRFPDLDAAFYSARKANGIFPGTVTGITLFVEEPGSGGSGLIGLTQYTASYATLLLRQYSSQAHSQNLKLGVMVSFCDQILNLNAGNFDKGLLLGLISVTDYIICEIYPSYEDSFENVKNAFELVKAAFSKVAPSLEIILFTGFQISRYSFRNSLPFYQNYHKIIRRFWDEVERWSIESRQKVYMNQAFDTFEKMQVGYGTKALLNGYWQRVGNDGYIVKGTQEIVSV